jgi:dolichyl-phosphate-mannose--protein O-mannosyl transferase
MAVSVAVVHVLSIQSLGVLVVILAFYIYQLHVFGMSVADRSCETRSLLANCDLACRK